MGLRALLAREDAGLRASELEAALEGALSAIAAALERRDPATAGHERRVAELAREIGTELGLSEDRLRGLYVAAVVHDIGKIGIPAEIINKPGLLTELEYAFMKEHAQFGADIMRNIPFPWPIAEIVHQHHEFLDGSGYPRGLAGDAILLEARILTVADVFEAMTAFRAYHVGIETDAALAELRKLAGIHFDAAVVEACARVIARGKFIPFPAPSQTRPQHQLA
jgi:putative nucleotidyltransferase with HDIG domain